METPKVFISRIRKTRKQDGEWWYITIPRYMVETFPDFFKAYEGKPVSVSIKPVARPNGREEGA